MTPSVIISEVAPRDGFQPIKTFIPTEQKLAVIRALIAAGVRQMEVSSFVSPKAVPQLADAAEILRALREDPATPPDFEACVLVPNRKGVELALANKADRIGFVLSVTESHNQSNVRRPVAESLADVLGVLKELPVDGPKIRVNFSCCFHCPFEGVVPEDKPLALISQVIGARPKLEIAIADTTGNAAPDQVKRVCGEAVRRWGKDVSIAFHGHDTYNMGIANVYAAYEAGIRVFDGAAGGIGGCPFAPGATGNIATEDIAWLFARMGVATGLDLEKLLAAADLAASVPGGMPSGHLRSVISRRPAPQFA
ncbi:MAG: hydroxymethylglutaryl-CoA lyase [Alphaproteobacteria bacterium]|nr:hydroxymethylglutaryl-CoA lyase [Alphaproteobacteria bacterium]